MFAEQNKGGDIPAHDKHTDGSTYYRIADGIYIAKVFRGKEEGIGPEGFHEWTVHGTEQDKPEQQQHLVLPEMKE